MYNQGLMTQDFFLWVLADTNRPLDYTLIYFKLSYACPN